MPIVIEQLRLVYVSVPKCACSSLKLFFHQVATGRPWNEEKERLNTTIHRRYPSVAFSEVRWGKYEGLGRIAVIRRPVDRLISCYADKVEKREVLKSDDVKPKLVARGLPTTPSFETFVEHLEDYRDASTKIKRHSERLSYWLGSNPAVYEKLINIRDLASLEAWVEAKGGVLPPLRHSNRSNSRIKATDLPMATRKKVRAMFEEDMDLFGHWLQRRPQTRNGRLAAN